MAVLWHIYLYVVTLLMLTMISLSSCQTSRPYIKSFMGNVVVDVTGLGSVRGVTYSSQYENLPNRWVNAFLGVPYAKTLEQYGSEWREKYRFHNPDDDPYWYGTYDATTHKPACPQMPWLVKETVWNFNEVSEDCLYLDIYAPNITTESISANPNLYPVLVFLHGGGFIMGASKQWPGVFLAERFIVVVVVNYRLNALGFFSTGDLYSPGNYGMFDQIKALQFVKKHISAFRGNPNKITLMGQSAGAASVGMHILSPRSVDLFHQAIMLSGSELSEWAVISTADSKEYARRLCQQVGCPTGDSQQMVDCLRYSRSFEQIVNASAMVRMLKGKIGNPWAPVVDGPIVGQFYSFLSDPPAVLRRQLRNMKVPLLVGMVRDEGAYFIPNLPNLIDGVTQPQFHNILDEFIRYRDIDDKSALFDAMDFQYTYWPQPTNYSFIRKKLVEMMGDYMFGAAISETMRAHVLSSPVYSYVFEYSSLHNYNPQWRGIAHGQDLDYIFGIPFINDTYRDLLGFYPRQFYDYADRNISEFMITMITNFTSTGAPTPRTEHIRFYRNVTWYHYNIDNHTYLSINNRSENKVNYRQTEFHFWNDFFPKLALYTNYYANNNNEDPDSASTFELTTWGLTAAAGVLLFIVICLIVLLICRSRTKKYPKYDSSPPEYEASEAKEDFSRERDDFYLPRYDSGRMKYDPPRQQKYDLDYEPSRPEYNTSRSKYSPSQRGPEKVYPESEPSRPEYNSSRSKYNPSQREPEKVYPEKQPSRPYQISSNHDGGAYDGRNSAPRPNHSANRPRRDEPRERYDNSRQRNESPPHVDLGRNNDAYTTTV